MKAAVLTSPFRTFRIDLQTTLVYQVQSLYSISRLDYTRYVDLARTLTDHLNVHVALCERGKHTACNADHIAQFAHKRKDGHVRMDGDL